MVKEIVQFWKGNENAYRELYIRGRIKDNVRYTVLQNDGSVREYLGKKVIGNCDLEQLPALDNAISVSEFQENFKKGVYKNCRLLVGDDNAFDENGNLLDEYTPSVSDKSLWFAVVFGESSTEPTQLIDFSNKTARIKAYQMKEYQVVDNVLTSYNQMVWHEGSV